jgi:hypothetical protein
MKTKQLTSSLGNYLTTQPFDRPAERTFDLCRNQPTAYATAKTPAKWSAYQILSVIIVFVILVFKV